METSFSEFKKKDVVNLGDGKNLGKTKDLVFTYPDGRLQGIVVPGKRGCCLCKSELYIDLRCIVKVGKDAIFVELSPPSSERKGQERPPRFDPSRRWDEGE